MYKRAKFTEESKTLDPQGPIVHDIFSIKRFLLNQVDLKLKLYRNTPEFSLCSGESAPNYRIDISEIYVLAKKVRLNPAVLFGHAAMLKTTNAKYAFNKTAVRVQSIASGSTSFHWENLFQGQRPNRIVVAFVSSKAINGHYGTNPFNFLHCKITSIGLFVNGLAVNGNPLKLDFNKTNGASTVRAFTDLFNTYDTWNQSAGNNISREDFNNGSTLFAFQLEPYFGDEQNFLSLLKTGNVRLDVQFGTPLAGKYTFSVMSIRFK